MYVAITGTSGFFGSYLLAAIREKGWKHEVFDRSRHSLADPSTLDDFIRKASHVVHLAALPKNVPHDLMRSVNVDGTRHLVDAILRKRQKTRLIFASSMLTYYEDDAFGQSKREAEEYIETQCSRWPEYLSAVVLRFANIYGVGVKPFHNSVVGTFVHQVRNQEPITINGDGSTKRDFLHVRDAVSAVLQAIAFTVPGFHKFDIGSGQWVTLQELTTILQTLNRKPLEIRYNSADTPETDIRPNYFDATNRLRWTPNVTLVDGLREMLEQV